MERYKLEIVNDQGESYTRSEPAPDGSWVMFKDAEARIAELEAALRDVLPYVDTCNSSHREAQAKGYAALEGRRDDPAA